MMQMLAFGLLVLGAFADCKCGPAAGQCSCSDAQCAPGHHCVCMCDLPRANICGCEGSGNKTQTMQEEELEDPCSGLAGSYSGELLADAPSQPSGHCKMFQDATVQGDQAILITSHCTECHCDSGFCDCGHSPWLITGTCNNGLINGVSDTGKACQLVATSSSDIAGQCGGHRFQLQKQALRMQEEIFDTEVARPFSEGSRSGDVQMHI